MCIGFILSFSFIWVIKMRKNDILPKLILVLDYLCLLIMWAYSDIRSVVLYLRRHLSIFMMDGKLQGSTRWEAMRVLPPPNQNFGKRSPSPWPLPHPEDKLFCFSIVLSEKVAPIPPWVSAKIPHTTSRNPRENPEFEGWHRLSFRCLFSQFFK